jgi:creatinine amidohydrolase
MIIHWNHLTSPELGKLAVQDPVAVMALGAIEQHGPHLPLATDLIIAEGLRDAALKSLSPTQPFLVLPSLAIGASQEHASFPGTLSLAPDEAVGVIHSVGESVHRAGIRRLVLINAHGGNHAVMTMAALDLRRRLNMLVVKASYLRFDPPDGVIAAQELRHGLHGGQAETAIMLHLAPDRVRMDQVRDFTSTAQATRSEVLGPENQAAWAWLAEDLNPAGVVGRASLATAGLGKQLVAHYSQILARVLAETGEMEVGWQS